MFIEPSTNIRILKDVPLDNKYVNTIYFPTSEYSEQYNYFVAFTKHILTEQTYQRVNKGIARVNIKAEDLYDCNYMMFQNNNFGKKWFYAFITGVNYVNNVVSEIEYEIDVMQSWYFDYELRDSFVEREHSITDNIGDNIVAESVDTGEYVYSNYGALKNSMADMIVIIAIVDTNGETVAGTVHDGVYSGSTLYAYNYDDVTSINNKLSEYVKSPDSVVAMYTAPKLLVPNVQNGGTILGFKTSGSSIIVGTDALDGTEDFDGYIPKNKKLYTYPFNYFHLDNASGNSLALRYEFFDGLKPVIFIDGCVTSPVKIVARPCSYKGMPPYTELGGYKALNNEAITLEGYPICSWNTDSYKAWLAQNSVPMMSNLFMGSAASVAFSNPLGIVGSVTSILSQQYTASIKADISKGNISSGNVNVSNNRQQFYSARVHITGCFAKIIDSYFHMYGYAINKVKVPNRSSRPKWNYVKTNGCNAIGSVPADDMAKIKTIYDNGITFWKTNADIGKYTDDNDVLLDNFNWS